MRDFDPLKSLQKVRDFQPNNEKTGIVRSSENYLNLLQFSCKTELKLISFFGQLSGSITWSVFTDIALLTEFWVKFAL